MIKVKHYTFKNIIYIQENKNDDYDITKFFNRIQDYYNFESIDAFYNNNKDLNNLNFSELEDFDIEENKVVDVNMDNYEIVASNINYDDNKLKLKYIINHISNIIPNFNILYFELDDNKFIITNKIEKNNLIETFKINIDKVTNEFNFLRSKIIEIFLQKNINIKNNEIIKIYIYDFNSNYQELIQNFVSVFPVLNKVYLIDKNIYINNINLNEFNHNTFFCTLEEYNSSPDKFVPLFYNLKKMKELYVYITKVITNIPKKDFIEIEKFCDIKLEELKNKKIITFLKINNTNPLKKVNEKRYRIHLNDTKNKMLLAYTTDNKAYYNTYGYEIDNEYPMGDDVTRYLLGNFTKILLPEESNTYISEKYMQPIINNLVDGKPVFIFGYGTSGSGKTSTLIYYRDVLDNTKNENGIISNLCTKTIAKYNNNNNNKITKLHVSFEEISDGGKILKLKDKDYLIFDKDLKFVRFTDNNKNILDIKHNYRFDEIVNNQDYNSLFSIFDFNEAKNVYYYKNTNTLSEIVQYLVDTDRHVKATLNNPQSSRSHVLIYIDFMTTDDTNVTTLIVGDFAGVEASFSCNSQDVLNKMLNITNTITNEPFYYTLNDYNTGEVFKEEKQENEKDEIEDINVTIQNFKDNKKDTFFIKDDKLLNYFTAQIIKFLTSNFDTKKKDYYTETNDDTVYGSELLYLLSIKQIIDFTSVGEYTVDDIDEYLQNIFDNTKKNTKKIKEIYEIYPFIYDLKKVANKIKEKNKDNKKKNNSFTEFTIWQDAPLFLNFDDPKSFTIDNEKKRINNYNGRYNDINTAVDNFLNENMNKVYKKFKEKNNKNITQNINDYVNQIINELTKMNDMSNKVSIPSFLKEIPVYKNDDIEVYINNDKKMMFEKMSHFGKLYIPYVRIKQNVKINTIIKEFKNNYVEKNEIGNRIKNKINENINGDIIELEKRFKLNKDNCDFFSSATDNDYAKISKLFILCIQEQKYVGQLQLDMLYNLAIIQSFFISEENKCINAFQNNEDIKYEMINMNDTNNISKFNLLLKYYYLTICYNKDVETYVNLIYNKYKKIIKSCLLRNNEGEFINRSLFSLNKDMVNITKQNMNIRGSDNPNFYKSFFLRNCIYRTKTEDNQNINYLDDGNNIIKLIENHCGKDCHKNIIFCIIGFLNISSLTDNPPIFKYSDDLDLCKDVLEKLKLYNTDSFDFNEFITVNYGDNNNKKKEEEEKEDSEVKDIKNNIVIVGNSIRSTKDQKEKLRLELESSNLFKKLREYYKRNKKKQTNPKIDRIMSIYNKYSTELKFEQQNTKNVYIIHFEQLIDAIKKINNYTTIGTLEYIDKMAKFNVTENLCALDDNRIVYNNDDTVILDNSEKFYNLDYFSKLF